MRLWIGIHLPQLQIEVFEPWSSDRVSVVLEHEKVTSMSTAARTAGVRPGMRRGGVLMLEPDARIHERSATMEEAALQATAMALLHYTPQVAHAEESVILLDVGASLTLFGGPRAICRRVRADLRALGLTGRLSCAPTARGAWMLARAGGKRVLRLDTMTRSLDALPALVVPAARPYSGWLEGIGCQTVAELRRLPRPGLQRRCGRQVLDTLDSAWGTAPEVFEWVEAPEKFEAKIELFDRIENAELLLAGAQRLILQLVGWLAAKLLAVERITLFLEHERGRDRRPPTALDIVLAAPVWDGDHIVRLLKERLAKTELENFVIGLALEAVQVRPLEPPSNDLFPEPGGSPEDQLRVMELLVSRLGADRVRQSKPIADYRPEVANAWISVQDTVREAATAAQLPPALDGILRPTWLLAKPIALLMRNHRPWYSSPLRIVSGPERIEAGWWSDGASRDYYVAQGEGDSALYWIFRERIGGAADADPRYFLHGLFG
jgi:protein ImuB